MIVYYFQMTQLKYSARHCYTYFYDNWIMLQPEIVLGFIGQHTLKSEESIFFFFC